MPQNFQDAIFVTRVLGLQYLWIDSLCIVQDSTEDWAIEGSQMDKIYKHAFVTIAATSASTSEEGFLDYVFRDRMFSILIQTQEDHELVPPRTEDSFITARYMETRSGSWLDRDVDNTTWNARGWTLQERHLSRRIIHFSKSQIFWECRRGFMSECGQRILNLPYSITRAYGPNDSSDDSEPESCDAYEVVSLDAELQTTVETPLVVIRTGLYNYWFQVLADYSRRKLTYASDKFPAISGLVKEVNAWHLDITQREDQYVAGIWIGALADCLLWMPEDPMAMSDPGIYRAPSWSWARWDGIIAPSPRVWTDLRPESCLVEYIDHEIVLNTPNRYGSIKSAVLRVRARIIGIVRRARYAGRDDGASYSFCIAALQGDVGFMTFDRGQEVKTDTVESVLHADFYAMQVMRQNAQLPDRSGIVLQMSGRDGTFERVGVFQLDEKHLDLFSSVGKDIVTLV
jgi:hypothetical protein